MSTPASGQVVGHCNCQRNSITVTLPAIVSGECHCTDCRRFTGATHSRNMAFERESVVLKDGGAKKWTVKGLKGQDINRWFCTECGSSLWCTREDMPALIMPFAGLFEPGNVPSPAVIQWTDRLEEWEQPAAGAQTFNKDYSP